MLRVPTRDRARARPPRLATLALLLFAGLACAGAAGTGRGASHEAGDTGAAEPRTHYKGRRIAPTMSFHGAAWLLRDSREEEEQPALLLEALGLEPGMTVCDLGAGNGFHTLLMAEAVGPTGRVLAVDIQPEMLEMLRERAAAAGATSVETVLGTVDDPHLPASEVDLVLMVDVYHELSHPEEILRAVHRALKPDGRMVLVEFRGEDPEIPIKPLHKMTRRQILREVLPNGFRLAGDYAELPWQHVLFFVKVGEETKGPGVFRAVEDPRPPSSASGQSNPPRQIESPP